MRREYLGYPGKKELFSNLKTEKLKTKKLLKITSCIRRTKALSTISRASLKMRKYVFTKTWKVSATASISEKKYSRFSARKNPKQQYMKVVTFSNPSFSEKHIYV